LEFLNVFSNQDFWRKAANVGILRLSTTDRKQKPAVDEAG